MNQIAAVIEQRRSLMRQAIKRGDMNTAAVHCGVVTLLRLSAGEFDVRLRPVKEVLGKGQYKKPSRRVNG